MPPRTSGNSQWENMYGDFRVWDRYLGCIDNVRCATKQYTKSHGFKLVIYIIREHFWEQMGRLWMVVISNGHQKTRK